MLTTNRTLNIQKFLVSGLCALLGVTLATLPTQATVSALPPRPTPVTPTPTAMPASTSPGWAVIELHVQAARPELWTVVQWQDRRGGWHDVEGWRGTLEQVSDGVGKKVWWVARANFDTGPFRWVIYQSPGGKLLSTSEAFRLPRYENTMGVIEVSLK